MCKIVLYILNPLPYLSSQSQEVAVELHIRHDLCKVLIVLHILIKLQEHAMASQHEGHLLLNDSAQDSDVESLTFHINQLYNKTWIKKNITSAQQKPQH